MPEPNKCPQCGTPVASGALAGLCPACLLKAGTSEDTVTDAKQGAFTPPSVAELAAKFPRLEILELIGKGGMGAVYKARQRQLDRIVALKILPPGIGDDPAFAERFAREAKALAKLNHPNIVTLYEFGDAGGQFYFLMEFVDGVNLRQLLHAGRISPREALAIVPQICDALQFAHDQGIVHRDIKPENILLDRRGRVKVADFGLAKIMGGEGDEPVAAGQVATGSIALTDAGKMMGTPQYMSPEQKENPGEVDHRADIYALGVVFYQMLTGELPGKKLEAPSRKVSIDVRLDEIVLRALEQKP
ncbi:MAG TPA: serine/threonine-protein kinase [Candidatus Sulfotelmatobacter sp.]|nr:serine/threonine-protein kinase [Candidatus Sulfotelmatobacter sp.]